MSDFLTPPIKGEAKINADISDGLNKLLSVVADACFIPVSILSRVGKTTSLALDIPEMYIKNKSREIEIIGVEKIKDIEVRSRIKRRLKMLDIEQSNIENIVQKSIKYLPTGDVSADKPDEDWIASFFDNVKTVQSEGLKEIWAKILAGEVVTPGTYSIKLLTTLKTISYHEAQIFQNLCNYIWSEGNLLYIFSDSDKFEITGLSYEDFDDLEDFGLIDQSFGLKVDFQVTNPEHVVVFDYQRTRKVCLKPNSTNTSFHIPLHARITRIGKELYNLIEELQFKEEYFDSSVNKLKTFGDVLVV